MLRSGSLDLVRQEIAAWAAGTGMARGVLLDAARARGPGYEGKTRRVHAPARDLSFARAPVGPVRDRPPARLLLPGRDQEFMTGKASQAVIGDWQAPSRSQPGTPTPRRHDRQGAGTSNWPKPRNVNLATCGYFRRATDNSHQSMNMKLASLRKPDLRPLPARRRRARPQGPRNLLNTRFLRPPGAP